MALISCPECNQQMSDTAGICPHCGYKIPKKPKAGAPKKKQPLDWILHFIMTAAFSVSLFLFDFCEYSCRTSDPLTVYNQYVGKITVDTVRRSEPFSDHLYWRLDAVNAPYFLNYLIPALIVLLLVVAVVIHYYKTTNQYHDDGKKKTIKWLGVVCVALSAVAFLASTYIGIDNYGSSNLGPVTFKTLTGAVYFDMALLGMLLILNILNAKEKYLLKPGKKKETIA